MDKGKLHRLFFITYLVSNYISKLIQLQHAPVGSQIQKERELAVYTEQQKCKKMIYNYLVIFNILLFKRGNTISQIAIKKRSTFAGDVFSLVSGATFAQVLSFISAPLLSRLFAPEAYGVSALFMAITSFISVIACLRYQLSIMLPKDDKEAANLLCISVGFSILIALLIIPVIHLKKDLILQWLNAEELSSFVWLIPLMVLVSGITSAMSYWNSRTKNFKRQSATRVISSAMTTSGNLAMGFAGYASASVLIFTAVAGQSVASMIFGFQIWRSDSRLLLSSIRFRDMISGIVRYRKFPLIDIWGGLLNSISWQLPILMLSVFFSQQVVGYYAVSFRLIQMPMSLIGAALGQVFFQRSAEMRENPERLAENVEMVFQRLVAFCLFPALLLSIVGQECFEVILGQQWSEAGIYSQILSIWMFWWFISSPLSTIFIISEKQELAFIVHFCIFGSRLISLVIGGFYGNIYLTLGLFSASGSLVYGLLSFWNLSLAGVKLKSVLSILTRYAFYSLPGMLLLVLFKINSVNRFTMVCVLGLELLIYYIFIIVNDKYCYSRFHSVVYNIRGWII